MILDLFAGIGWAEGLRQLGLSEIGIEWDASACSSRAAAGHRTIRADVASYPPSPFVGRVEGLVASPPCPDWSTAGSMARDLGATGGLVHVVPQWVDALRPEWVVCEQVPLVTDVWRDHAYRYEQAGYRTWVGVLDAASYGVPQNRLRAILLAHRSIAPAPPAPTHGEAPAALWGSLAPPATLADAVGLEPGWVYDSGQNSRTAGGGLERYRRSCDRPAGTLTTKSVTQWVLRRDDQRRKLTIADALTLQGFRADLPLQGTTTAQHRQIGNAVPPPLAAAVIGALIDGAREVAA